ncbi:ABC transporter permease [Mucilaginibacter sp. ZT4R22]|uniref:ABC transporter permease n=1 Tax=Mucilaginibacter pankratovii TaxID=2772110 RepID=A0ABR7WXP4_9SPHI|nr:ABC transporter permease [Mucilaginibacter pankratovii]MBD1367048.1 ABC transporter permease [Mucilaginibacter pankratovii]
MIKNLFKTAWRNVYRQRSYTLINIIGLGSGIAVCLVIFVLIQFHTSFDNFHAKKDRIYRLLTEYHHADSKDIFYGKGVSWAVPQFLKQYIPAVEEVAPVFNARQEQMQVLNAEGQVVKKFKETQGVFATTPAFFRIFDFPMLQGSPDALKDPNIVFLSQATAERYFGDWHKAIDQSIKWNNQTTMKVAGILKNSPLNTDFDLQIVFSLGTGWTERMVKEREWNGTMGSFGCYVLTPPGMTGDYLTTQARAMVKKNHEPGNNDSEIAQALNAVHYDTKAGDFSDKSISPQMIRMLWMIALFILIIACVNFVNLATAQSVSRAKEVGIRKVLGGNRWQLQMQFLAETLVIVLVSVLLAAGIGLLAVPMVGKIMELPLAAGMLLQWQVAIFLVVLTIGVTVVAGFYPSLVLSGFNPINALKSKLAFKTPKGISLRHALVVFQFIIAQGLIICTIIIVKQMNYFTHESMGFAKDAIVNVPFPGDSVGISKLDYLKQRLAGIKGVELTSLNSSRPADGDEDWTNFIFENSPKRVDFYSIVKMVDENYAPLYKLKFVAGHNMAQSDTIREFLVNEALVAKLGISKPEDALNKQIAFNDKIKGKIVGVLKNYHNRSFKEDYAPLLLSTNKTQFSLASIQLSASSFKASLPGVEKVWNDVYPEFVFEYQFVDEQLASFYKQENQLSSIYQSFAVVAILLSCLGLYGLASFMAVQRIKEVGIRKVLGSSVSGIVYLFSKEFVVLVVIGFAIASPVTWYLMNKWLQDYTNKISIHWSIFAMAGGIAVCIALATVSSQLIKAALVNPVKSLRSE